MLTNRSIVKNIKATVKYLKSTKQTGLTLIAEKAHSFFKKKMSKLYKVLNHHNIELTGCEYDVFNNMIKTTNNMLIRWEYDGEFFIYSIKSRTDVRLGIYQHDPIGPVELKLNPDTFEPEEGFEDLIIAKENHSFFTVMMNRIDRFNPYSKSTFTEAYRDDPIDSDEEEYLVHKHDYIKSKVTREERLNKIEDRLEYDWESHIEHKHYIPNAARYYFVFMLYQNFINADHWLFSEDIRNLIDRLYLPNQETSIILL